MATGPMLPGRSPLEELSTADLVKDVLTEARELVKLEVDLARSEVEGEVAELVQSAFALGASVVAALLFLAMISVAVVVALGGTSLAAIGVGVVFAVASGVTGWVGYRKLPKKPLARTRRRLRADLQQLKEHVA